MPLGYQSNNTYILPLDVLILVFFNCLIKLVNNYKTINKNIR